MPTPTGPRRSRRFWNLIAKRYARMPVTDEAAYQHKLALTRALLRPDMRVLDFGCGTGTTALNHAPYVAHIDAIDYAPKMIDIARAKAQAAAETRVSFTVATIETWPAEPGSYDAVLGMSILHLLPDPAAVLRRVFDLLEPGGRFFSNTICIGDTGGLLKYCLPIVGATRLLPRVAPMKAANLTRQMIDAGFEIEQNVRPGAEYAVFVIARKPGQSAA